MDIHEAISRIEGIKCGAKPTSCPDQLAAALKEYLKASEPDRVSKGYIWRTAIGLQAVDGLNPSRYLIDTAIQNIEG